MQSTQDDKDSGQTSDKKSATAQAAESKIPGPVPGEDMTSSPLLASQSASSASATPDIERPKNDEPAEGDWDAMETELAAWGRQLDQLRVNAHLVGRDVLDDLEARYEEVNRQAQALRHEAEEQLQKAQASATETAAQTSEQTREVMKDTQEFVEKSTAQAKESFDHLSAQAKAQSEAAAANLKDTSEKLWIGAQEMGEGFKRAWVELRQTFDSATTKMQDKDLPDQKVQK